MPLHLPVNARLSSFYFCFFAYVGVYLAWFPVYLAARGLDAAGIAWILALPSLARIVAPGAWGWLADRTGAQRAIVVFSCAANATCWTVLPFVQGTTQIAWLIGTTSVLSAAALPLVEAITLGALAGQQGRYGPIRLWGSFGFIATVLAGGFWLDLHGAQVLPGAMAAFSLVSLTVALGLPRGTAHAPDAARSSVIGPPAVALLAAGFGMAAAHGALYAFFTLHLQREGYGTAFIGFAWTLGVLAEILVFLYLPALFRRYPLSLIIAASCAIAAVRFLAIGWAAHLVWLLVLAQLMHAATFGSFHAAAVAAVQRVFPPGSHNRGQALLSSLSFGAGGAAGTLLAGWGWELAGPAGAFSFAALAGGSGLLFASSLKRAGL